MNIRWKSLLAVASVVLSSLLLSGCDGDSFRVYGSVSVGNSWGGYHGHGNRSRVHTGVTVSGRIR